jgi:hypothetical protein
MGSIPRSLKRSRATSWRDGAASPVLALPAVRLLVPACGGHGACERDRPYAGLEKREIKALFRSGRAPTGDVARLTAAIANVEGRIRLIHLRGQIEIEDPLTGQQIAAYDRLRGYAGAGHGHEERARAQPLATRKRVGPTTSNRRPVCRTWTKPPYQGSPGTASGTNSYTGRTRREWNPADP